MHFGTLYQTLMYTPSQLVWAQEESLTGMLIHVQWALHASQL